MRFNSYAFALFFAALLPAVLAPAQWRPAQNVLLLAAGYYFYACWNPRFLSLLILSTVVDYACGLWLGRVENPARPARHPRAEHGAQPGHARLLQVLQFLRREPARAAGERGRVDPARAPRDRAADRHLVLHVPVDELRHRRLSPRDHADAQPRPVRDVRLVLPAPGRRPDHAADVAAAAGRHAAAVRPASVLRGLRT